MLAAFPQLEFASQTTFPWWTLIVAAIAVALVIHGILVLLEPDTPQAHAIPKILRGLAPIILAALLLPITLFLLLLHAPPWLTLFWTLGSAALATQAFYFRVYRFLSTGRLAILLSLRLLAVVALLLLLFRPVLAFIQQPANKDKIAVVIDASGSMSIADAPNEPNRYRQSVLAVRDVLAPQLADRFDLQVFAYDGKHTEPLPSLDELDKIAPNGNVTDLTVAMNLGTSTGASQIVLFSDGIHNGPVAPAGAASSIGVPIHTVRVGNTVTEPSTVPDIAVVGIDGPQTATVNNAVTLTASIKSTAMSDRAIRVSLHQGERQWDEQRLVLRSGPTPQTVQLKFTPEKVGRTVVRVSVPVDPQERSAANNQQDFPLIVTDPKLAVLYVEGRVRREVGVLSNALRTDPNINLINMYQVQAGNFHLEGAKKDDDLKGLPTTLAQWKRFRVIVLGDLDATFLNAQQQKDLEQAVREGTGLLMIGGQNAFAPGGWGKTTLANILPVSLDKVDPPQIYAKFVPKLTASGLSHSILKNIAGYFIAPDGAAPAQALPELLGSVAVANAKPGADILAVHPTAKVNGQPAVVLAVGQYGQGRTAAFTADTTWQWQQFLRSQGKDSPYNRFWGQMVRWLAGQEDLAKKTGASVTAMIPKERYDQGEAVALRCAVTDLQGQSTEYAAVSAEIKTPDGKTTRVPMSAVKEQLGMYEAAYKPTMAGGFDVTFSAGKDGKDLGRDKSGFSVLQAGGEMDRLAADPSTLKDISNNTHGLATEIAGVQQLAERIAERLPDRAVPKKTSFPGWNDGVLAQLAGSGSLGRITPASLAVAAAILLFALEIFLRRKWQLQ